MNEPLPTSLVTELELRQDEVIRQLDQLDARIEAAIRDFSPAAPQQGDVAA